MFIFLLFLPISIYAGTLVKFDWRDMTEEDIYLPLTYAEDRFLYHIETLHECRVDTAYLERVLQGKVETNDPLLLVLKDYNDRNDQNIAESVKQLRKRVLDQRQPFFLTTTVGGSYLTLRKDSQGVLRMTNHVYLYPTVVERKYMRLHKNDIVLTNANAVYDALCTDQTEVRQDLPYILGAALELEDHLSQDIEKSEHLHGCRFMSLEEIRESVRRKSAKCVVL